MEKRGVVQPGYTRDIEERLVKRASTAEGESPREEGDEEASSLLDDDTTKRLMQRVVRRFDEGQK